MKIYLASDHAGFELKNQVKEWLLSQSYEVKDFGANVYDENDDYPSYIKPAAYAVSKNPQNRAIIFGGSGQGEAIVANRFKKVRAIVYYGANEKIIQLSRQHNDSNILSVGARFVSFEELQPLLSLWLKTTLLEDNKYQRRIKQTELIMSSVQYKMYQMFFFLGLACGMLLFLIIISSFSTK